MAQENGSVERADDERELAIILGEPDPREREQQQAFEAGRRGPEDEAGRE